MKKRYLIIGSLVVAVLGLTAILLAIILCSKDSTPIETNPVTESVPQTGQQPPESETPNDEVCSHVYGEWSVVIPATCTEQGEEERICSKCGEKETRTLNAIEHHYVSGACEYCGEVLPIINNLEFTLLSDGTYEVSGIRICNANEIVIPSTYNGKPVTSIGAQAFYNCSSLTSIEILDGVKSIDTWALYGCSSLASIEIPDSVTSIGDSAFQSCSSLTSIEIPDGVMSIGYRTFY
ncbi:MAG: leucine-rich repeat domain-containing protein, partial [Christensenellaceae bacterium]